MKNIASAPAPSARRRIPELLLATGPIARGGESVIDAAEINPDVVALAREFFKAGSGVLVSVKVVRTPLPTTI